MGGTTNQVTCAAPDLSTLDDSLVKVDISHGNSSSKLASPMPRTIAPEDQEIFSTLNMNCIILAKTMKSSKALINSILCFTRVPFYVKPKIS